MKNAVPFLASSSISIFSLVFGSLLAASSVRAEDIKVEITLVWATSDEAHKADNEQKFKPLEPELAKEFHEPFKWKYYFLVRREAGTVTSRGSKAFKVSGKCELKVTELPGPEVIVELFGEGKPVNKTKKSLERGEIITIGHGDKDDSAWFVVVRRPKD